MDHHPGKFDVLCRHLIAIDPAVPFSAIIRGLHELRRVELFYTSFTLVVGGT